MPSLVAFLTDLAEKVLSPCTVRVWFRSLSPSSSAAMSRTSG